ncbi:MAG: hypothetical protein PVJ92_01230 [Candidatus Dependentiae bacterium]|jgi:hypothetical protein
MINKNAFLLLIIALFAQGISSAGDNSEEKNTQLWRYLKDLQKVISFESLRANEVPWLVQQASTLKPTPEGQLTNESNAYLWEKRLDVAGKKLLEENKGYYMCLGMQKYYKQKGSPLRADRFQIKRSSDQNPVVRATDFLATRKKMPYVLALVALLSYLARRGFKLGATYKEAKENLKTAENALYDLVPQARTKKWYKPVGLVVRDAINDTEDATRKEVIESAYDRYLAASNAYNKWRFLNVGTKAGMYGGAVGSVGSALWRHHERKHLPENYGLSYGGYSKSKI